MSIATILLVDDEQAFAETMTKRLTKRELDVTAVFDGESALTYLEENPSVEVVILDVKMPGMDGIDVLTAIKTRLPLVEVIMLTGHATVESAIEGMKLGAFDYLMKPCDLDTLIEKVTQAADKKRQHEEKIVEAKMKEITNRRA